MKTKKHFNVSNHILRETQKEVKSETENNKNNENETNRNICIGTFDMAYRSHLDTFKDMYVSLHALIGVGLNHRYFNINST